MQISAFRPRGTATIEGGVSDVASLAAESRGSGKGSKINVPNQKKYIYFLHSTFFTLLSKRKGNSIHNCDSFLKSVISAGGCHCDYSPWVPKNLAMPWFRRALWIVIHTHTHMYVCMCVYVCMYVCVYIYIYMWSPVKMGNAGSANMSNSNYSVLSVDNNITMRKNVPLNLFNHRSSP
jgi:hypothetical protein